MNRDHVPYYYGMNFDAGYGDRVDGTPKGHGWLGNISKNPNEAITELSIGVDFDGKEVLIPSIVPTLSREEVDFLGAGNQPTDSIVRKAVDHARGRMSKGQSVWADDSLKMQPLGGMLGNVFRNEALGVDHGLWYSKITGKPLDAANFQLNYGGQEKLPYPGVSRVGPHSEWVREDPVMGVAKEFGQILRERTLDPMVRTGDALTGKSQPSMAEFIKDAMDAVGVYSGPGVLAGKPMASGLSVFGGLRAAKPKVRMQQVAEVALAAGKNPDEVWTVTGWRKAADGKWRFEIDDSKAVFDYAHLEGRGTSTLGRSLKHDKLFEQYPELKDYRVRLGHPQSMENYKGLADPDSKTITIKADMTPEEAKSTLLHEIQHMIQEKEGFARGGRAESEGYGNYMKLHGEGESRDVQGRMTWDADMRREVPPDALKDAIIRFGNKEAAEIERELLR